MKRYFSLILIVALLLFSFTACGSDSNITPNSFHSNTPGDNVSGSSSDVISDSENSTLTEVEFAVTASDMFTKRDKKTEYDNSAVRIQLNGSSATANSDKVQISDSTVTITEEDTYILSGTLDDGTIIVNADNSAKLHLIFDNVSINSNDSAAILVLSADKVIVTLASEQNSLSNGGIFTTIDDININAVLYSKEDLSLNGSGSLTINSPAGHGISCKDDLVLAGGSYTIEAASHGLDANDSIRLTASTLHVEAGKDGIHAENTDDASLGFVYIADGTYHINANDDGISARAYLQIEDGSFDITTTAASSSTDAGGKGLKSTNSMQISAGSFNITSFDDGIHSNADITIHNGSFTINAQDDGIHADANLTVNGGDINITESYEGLEALDLAVHGGNIRLVASDDGLNAAGGNDGSGFGGRGNDNFGGRGGSDNFNGNLPEDFSDWFNGSDGFNGNLPEDFNGGTYDDSSDSAGSGFIRSSTTGRASDNRGNRPDANQGGFGGDFNPEDLPDNFGGNFGGGNFGGGFPGGMGSSNGSITISGGKLYIQASGDGIDANGTLTITGGDITICGPSRGDTASLDYDTTATLSGATFIATGGNMMAQTFSTAEQGVIAENVGTQDAGTTVTLTDKKGKVLLTQTPELSYTLVILSSPDLVSGETYTLTYGTTTKTITAD